jgi:hypothetical protein
MSSSRPRETPAQETGSDPHSTRRFRTNRGLKGAVPALTQRRARPPRPNWPDRSPVRHLALSPVGFWFGLADLLHVDMHHALDQRRRSRGSRCARHAPRRSGVDACHLSGSCRPRSQDRTPGFVIARFRDDSGRPSPGNRHAENDARSEPAAVAQSDAPMCCQGASRRCWQTSDGPLG